MFEELSKSGGGPIRTGPELAERVSSDLFDVYATASAGSGRFMARPHIWKDRKKNSHGKQ